MKRVKINIRELREKHQLSLRELSRLTDIRHATLSELENGKRQRIQFDHIERIANELNISDIREIITLVDDNN